MRCSGGGDQLTGWLLEPRGPPARATERWRRGRRKARTVKKEGKGFISYHLSSTSFVIFITSLVRELHCLPLLLCLPPLWHFLFTPTQLQTVVHSMIKNTILAEIVKGMKRCGQDSLTDGSVTYDQQTGWYHWHLDAHTAYPFNKSTTLWC